MKPRLAPGSPRVLRELDKKTDCAPGAEKGDDGKKGWPVLPEEGGDNEISIINTVSQSLCDLNLCVP